MVWGGEIGSFLFTYILQTTLCDGFGNGVRYTPICMEVGLLWCFEGSWGVWVLYSRDDMQYNSANCIERGECGYNDVARHLLVKGLGG